MDVWVLWWGESNHDRDKKGKFGDGDFVFTANIFKLSYPYISSFAGDLFHSLFSSHLISFFTDSLKTLYRFVYNVSDSPARLITHFIPV